MAIIFSQIRAFHAVAENEGFTAAAKVLGIGQPTLTIQVRQLEEAYGVELFLRQGRRLTLTDTGRALLEATRGIMRYRDEAHEILTRHGRLEIGHLRLATVGPFHATEIIAEFKRAHPQAKVSTFLGNSERTLQRVIDFEADVAILARARDDERIEMIPYRTHRVVVFVSVHHPWFERSSVRIDELGGQPFVLRERGSTTRSAFEAALAARDLAVDPVFEIESREGVWKAVECGLGISVVADFEFIAHPNLRLLEIEGSPITTQYSLACLRDRRESRIVKSFLKAADIVRARHDGPASSGAALRTKAGIRATGPSGPKA